MRGARQLIIRVNVGQVPCLQLVRVGVELQVHALEHRITDVLDRDAESNVIALDWFRRVAGERAHLAVGLRDAHELPGVDVAPAGVVVVFRAVVRLGSSAPRLREVTHAPHHLVVARSRLQPGVVLQYQRR